jgi:hypothetical protein
MILSGVEATSLYTLSFMQKERRKKKHYIPRSVSRQPNDNLLTTTMVEQTDSQWKANTKAIP